MNNPINEPSHKKHSVFSHILKFIGWWFGFAGLYAMFSTCPFCGQTGCPVGAGTAGAFGGFVALLFKGKNICLALLSNFKRKNLNMKTNKYSESTEKTNKTQLINQVSHSDAAKNIRNM